MWFVAPVMWLDITNCKIKCYIFFGLPGFENNIKILPCEPLEELLLRIDKLIITSNYQLVIINYQLIIKTSTVYKIEK